jgi:hypothetical protein
MRLHLARATGADELGRASAVPRLVALVATGPQFLAACQMFSFRSRWAIPGVDIMEAAREREIIRLWNRLRLLKREGRPTTAVLREIEKALAERERHAA